MIGRVGTIHTVADFGALSVQYTPSLRRFYLSADTVVKVCICENVNHMCILQKRETVCRDGVDMQYEVVSRNF